MIQTNFIQETKQLVKRIETQFFELGARLYKIKEEKLWDGIYDNYTEFLDDAKINPSLASMLTAIHRTYVIENNVAQDSLAGIGYSNLYEAIPLVESDGIEGTLAKVRTLTRSEIKDEVREEKHGEHQHELGPERWAMCQICKKFVRIDL